MSDAIEPQRVPIDKSRTPTPVDCPYYGVHISDSEGKQITQYAFPQRQYISLVALPYGTYWNNRVYRLSCRVCPGDPPQTFILEVCARDSGRAKPCSEVNCLRFIEVHLPTLPVPRVVSWSHKCPEAERITSHSWILLTLLDGDSLDTVEDVDERDIRSVCEDTANFLANLRSGISSPGEMGSFASFNEADGKAIIGPPVDGPSLEERPKKTYLKYTLALLKAGLETKEIQLAYSKHDDLIDDIRDLLHRNLPRLPVFADPRLNSTSVLTNCDLSAQNILVIRPGAESGGLGSPGARAPLRLSGAVDWEYACFFSPVQEFLTASPELSQDVAGSYAGFLLPALTDCRIDTPNRGETIKPYWQSVRLLHRLQHLIVPWWTRGPVDNEWTASENDATAVLSSLIKEIRALTTLNQRSEEIAHH